MVVCHVLYFFFGQILLYCHINCEATNVIYELDVETTSKVNTNRDHQKITVNSTWGKRIADENWGTLLTVNLQFQFYLDCVSLD